MCISRELVLANLRPAVLSAMKKKDKMIRNGEFFILYKVGFFAYQEVTMEVTI